MPEPYSPVSAGEGCDCCGVEPSVGVAAIPGVPMSIAWGRNCLDANVVPWWVAVTNTAIIGGRAEAADWWVALLDNTIPYFNRTTEQFDAEVALAIEDMKE